MSLIQVSVFAAIMAATLAIPVHEAQSYSSYSSGPLESHDSLSLSHAPLAISHAPLAISHAPVIVASHAPVEVHHAAEVEHHAPAHYEFKYGVRDEHTHDIKEQAEKRDGDKVSGYYKLVEPDGTTRTVHYTADKHTGFHAQVVRSGHAAHPAAAPAHVHKVAAAPVISYGHAAPVISYSHAPVISYAHAAPVVSYSHEPLAASSHGSATSYSSSNLEQGSEGYH
ncbi:cuticle protein 7-like [Periplaneta americana]|uniref:cuticle protein 7-like n=1 Tax=Periplaneta americana TaxID=6978 RepID=UPI0037E9A94B